MFIHHQRLAQKKPQIPQNYIHSPANFILAYFVTQRCCAMLCACCCYSRAILRLGREPLNAFLHLSAAGGTRLPR